MLKSSLKTKKSNLEKAHLSKKLSLTCIEKSMSKDMRISASSASLERFSQLHTQTHTHT